MGSTSVSGTNRPPNAPKYPRASGSRSPTPATVLSRLCHCATASRCRNRREQRPQPLLVLDAGRRFHARRHVDGGRADRRERLRHVFGREAAGQHDRALPRDGGGRASSRWSARCRPGARDRARRAAPACPASRRVRAPRPPRSSGTALITRCDRPRANVRPLVAVELHGAEPTRRRDRPRFRPPAGRRTRRPRSQTAAASARCRARAMRLDERAGCPARR